MVKSSQQIFGVPDGVNEVRGEVGLVKQMGIYLAIFVQRHWSWLGRFRSPPLEPDHLPLTMIKIQRLWVDLRPNIILRFCETLSFLSRPGRRRSSPAPFPLRICRAALRTPRWSKLDGGTFYRLPAASGSASTSLYSRAGGHGSPGAVEVEL